MPAASVAPNTGVGSVAGLPVGGALGVALGLAWPALGLAVWQARRRWRWAA
jgi:hypothetical protein